MKFLVKNPIRFDDVPTIEQAVRTVDSDAKIDVDTNANTVGIDSWMFPEEFYVAFFDKNYDVKIVER